MRSLLSLVSNVLYFIKPLIQEKKVPAAAFLGVETYSKIGRNVENDLFVFSKPKQIFGTKKDASKEVETDLMLLTMLKSKLLLIFVEVKMSEFQVPWEENPEDQNVSLFSEAKVQLKKDVIRCMELFPDVKLSGKLDILCYAAFPNFERDEKINKDRSLILTKQDIENSSILYNKLHAERSGELKPTESVRELYKFIFGRYIGPISTIPNKSMANLISKSEKVLSISVASTDTALQSQIENVDPSDDILDTSLKDKLLEDKTTQDILQALEKKSYQKSLQSNTQELK